MASRGFHGAVWWCSRRESGLGYAPVQQGEGLFVKVTEHAQALILCAWLSRQQLSSFL
ncbi:hypothetical protein GBAR_LOCUS9941, partial [Geodia barretti]